MFSFRIVTKRLSGSFRFTSFTLCMLGNFSRFCCRLPTFFQNQLFRNILSGTYTECQTVWIQIRTDVVSVLIWVQIACKDCQQTTNVFASEVRVDNTYTARQLLVDNSEVLISFGTTVKAQTSLRIRAVSSEHSLLLHAKYGRRWDTGQVIAHLAKLGWKLHMDVTKNGEKHCN